ncbi:MAG: hypothetical protein PHD81_04530 [Candidatus Nanoarchaeia archaeon]|nr:hypothetical protein [Candidatus Nanoarchaeia archaeon]MDD5588343.1 hypothetical protein [Candidatus Nanoarchaeia archaeon]
MDNSISLFAFDESNHDQIPEFLVGFFSLSEKYVQEGVSKKLIKKGQIDNFLEFTEPYLDAYYKYCILTQDIKWEFESQVRKLQEQGIKCELVNLIRSKVIYSLLYGEPLTENQTNLYIDGKLNKRQREEIYKTCSSLPTKVKIYYGIDLDTKIPLVNFSDTIARSLFRRVSNQKNIKPILEKLVLDEEHYKPIIL